MNSSARQWGGGLSIRATLELCWRRLIPLRLAASAEECREKEKERHWVAERYPKIQRREGEEG